MTRTYLEMRRRSELKPAWIPEIPCRVERMHECPAAFWRFLYTEVGRDHRWVDRLPWSDDDIRAYLDDPAVSVGLLTVRGAPAGYFELRRSADRATEIAYFGLLKEFHGRGLGGHMLSEAVRLAWDAGATRVWLHTNTLDHAAALPNYLSRGFTIVRTEAFTIGH
ncbi:MAG: GNAT family N-acetyltransferase [Acidobacteriota bacterium]